MLRMLLPITVILFVAAACAPRDVAVDGSNGVNNKGGKGSGNTNGGTNTMAKIAFVVDKDGERAETCPGDKADYTSLVIPEGDQEGILNGTVKAVIEPGNRNCFRIGATAQIKNDFASNDVLVEVIVKQTEGIALSKLTKKHAEAFGMTVTDLKARGKALIDEVEAQKKFRPEGMVNITYFELPGAEESLGDDEKDDDKNDEVKVEQNLQTLIFTKTGDRSTTCSKQSKTWTFISIPAEQDDNIKNGKVIGWMGAGKKNCFEIGSQIALQEKNGPVRAQLKVLRVEIVPRTQSTAMHALSMGLSLIDFNELVSEDTYHMTFFEYVASSANTSM